MRREIERREGREGVWGREMDTQREREREERGYGEERWRERERERNVVEGRNR